MLTELRCAATDDLKCDALRYAVHFVGDIHHPPAHGGHGPGCNVKAVEVRAIRRRELAGRDRPAPG